MKKIIGNVTEKERDEILALKKGMTESIVFDKSHAGYGSSYIYYYVECENSKGSACSSVTYLIAKGR